MTSADASVWSPDYDGRSLTNVLPSVAAALGVPTWDNVLGLPPGERFVVVLVDGLGHRLLSRHRRHAPYLASLLDDRPPMACGVPSTTAASLTSLGTGLPPGRHGVVGYTCRIPGTDRVLNCLSWDDSIRAEDWQPYPNMLERLDAAGVAVSVVNKQEFAGSGLTLCSQRGVPYHGISSVYERLDVVVEVTEAAPRSLVYCYESTLDHTGHDRGCESTEWVDRLRTVDAELEAMREALPRDTTLVITSDHGMLDLPLEDRFDVDAMPSLLQDVVVLAGEARLRHVYVRAGAERDVAAHWQQVLGGRAVVLTRDDAESLGWFGPVDDAVRPRIGDVVVASLGTFGVFSSQRFRVEMSMRGFHGSITPDETEIPLLVDPAR